MKSLTDRIREANAFLAPFAVPHPLSSSLEWKMLGRKYREEEDETRLPFQRDRGRIIHSAAFRRLKHKTQVFVAGFGDHYRTRLTHTMEVAQISRDIARALSLNEDLAECIALAHDLGHPPFAHAGEEELNTIMSGIGLRFEHNEQSLRIVTLLERRCRNYPGLNLCKPVLEGLKKHWTAFDSPSARRLQPPCLEAQIANIADEIAYTAHDVEDGIRAKLLTHEMLRQSKLFKGAEERSSKHGTNVRGSLIHILIEDTYGESERNLARGTLAITFSIETAKNITELRSILEEHLYGSSVIRSRSAKGKRTLRTLFQHFLKSPPEKVLALQERTASSLPQAVCDYIAGMTDGFALHALQGVRSIFV
jgi:dGTPase